RCTSNDAGHVELLNREILLVLRVGPTLDQLRVGDGLRGGEGLGEKNRAHGNDHSRDQNGPHWESLFSCCHPERLIRIAKQPRGPSQCLHGGLLTSYENASRRHRLREQHSDPSTRAEALGHDGSYVISYALGAGAHRLFFSPTTCLAGAFLRGA